MSEVKRQKKGYSPLPREWLKTRIVVPHSISQIRLIHLNVLADQLSQPDGFLGTTKDDLDWKNRSCRLLELIASYHPDIVSLAECDHYDDFWVPHLDLIGLIPASPLVVKNHHTDKTHGVALFYRESDYLQMIKLSHQLTNGVAMVETHFSCPKSVYGSKESSSNFRVVTTHLKAKKHAEKERSQQLELIKNAILSEKEDEPKMSTIFTGDFNTDSDEKSLVGSMSELKLTQMVPIPWTTWKSRPPTDWQPGGTVKHAIDHFFGSQRITPTAYLNVPSDDDVEEAGLLPGSRYPSDHLAIGMDFIIYENHNMIKSEDLS